MILSSVSSAIEKTSSNLKPASNEQNKKSKSFDPQDQQINPTLFKLSFGQEIPANNGFTSHKKSIFLSKIHRYVLILG